MAGISARTRRPHWDARTPEIPSVMLSRSLENRTIRLSRNFRALKICDFVKGFQVRPNENLHLHKQLEAGSFSPQAQALSRFRATSSACFARCGRPYSFLFLAGWAGTANRAGEACRGATGGAGCAEQNAAALDPGNLAGTFGSRRRIHAGDDPASCAGG